MKTVHAALIAGLVAATPVSAQQSDGDIAEGLSLLQEGTRLILEQLMRDIGPMLDEIEDTIIDLNAYHLPEVLPNGDIIIRRKVPLIPDTGSSDEEIEL